MPKSVQPFCIFDGPPALGDVASNFIQTTMQHPELMALTLGSIKVLPNGETLFGVPGERDVTVDLPLVHCIGAAATVLRSGADGAFHYDGGTSQAALAANLSRVRRLAQEDRTQTHEARQMTDRITFLAVFAGRLANSVEQRGTKPLALRRRPNV